MRILLGLALIGLTCASTLHYTPLTLAATQQLRDQLPATREYLNQDNRGFYSYGYSGDSSAKAEYKSIDGSSIGFYSYVDANGKLQTVEYVANRQHGFQAAATNLPQAPVDNRVGPKPVKDTPEVEEAKRAHLEAYRVAELRANLANADQDNGDNDSDDSAELNSNENNAGAGDDERNSSTDDKNRENQNNEENNLSAQNAQLLNNLNIVYAGNLAQSRLSNSIDLNLLYANGRELSYLEQPLTTQYAALHPTTYGTVQLPAQSYYSVLTPSSSTRVITTLPRLRSGTAATYGNSLPLALGTAYLSHGTYAKK